MQMHRKLLNFPYFTLEEFSYALKHFEAPASKMLLQIIAYQILIKTNNKPPRFENALNCLLAYYQNPTSFARGFKIMNEKVFGALNFEMRVECFSQCTAAALAKVNGCVGFIPLGVDLQGQEYRILYPGYLLIINSKENNQEQGKTVKQWVDQVQMPEKWEELNKLLEEINYCIYTCDALGNYIYDENTAKGLNVKLWDKEPDTIIVDQSKEQVSEKEINQFKQRKLIISKLFQIIDGKNKLQQEQILDIMKTAGQGINQFDQQNEQEIYQDDQAYNLYINSPVSKLQKSTEQNDNQSYIQTAEQDFKSQENLIKLTIQQQCSPSQQRLKLSDIYIQQQLELLQLQAVNLIDNLDETKNNIEMQIKIVNIKNNPKYLQQVIDKIQVESLQLLYQQLQGKQPIYINNETQTFSQQTYSRLYPHWIQEFETVTDLCEQLIQVFTSNYYFQEVSYFDASLLSHNPLQELSEFKNYFTVTKIQSQKEGQTIFKFFHPKQLYIGNNEVLQNLPMFMYQKQVFPELIENQPLREALGFCEPTVKQVPEQPSSNSNQIEEEVSESSYSEDRMADDDEEFVPDEEEPDSDMTFSTDEKSSVQENEDESISEEKQHKKAYEVKYVPWKKYNKKTMISLDEHKHMSIDIVVYHTNGQQTQQQDKQLEQLFDNQSEGTTQQSSTALTSHQTTQDQQKPQPEDLVLVREYITPEKRAQSWDNLVRKFYPQEHLQGLKGKTFEQSKSAGKTIRFATCEPPELKQQQNQPTTSKKQLKSENKQLLNQINKRWEEYRETNGEEAYKQALRGKLFCKIIQKVVTDQNNSTGLQDIKQQLNKARMETNTADPASAYKFVDTIMKIVEKYDLVDEMIQQELEVGSQQ